MKMRKLFKNLIYFALVLVLVVQPQFTNNADATATGTEYYYNTGTTCPTQAAYTKHNLLNTVKKGDIIYEAAGGGGLTGHTAVVEGIFTSNGKTYIRLVEAIDKGVVRSILDDKRIDDRKGSVYRVNGATTTQINNAVSFNVGQLGKKYLLDFAKNTSASEANWYCSELNWAGYKNQGIDIETTGLYNEPGVTPRDITVNSSKVTKIR